MDDNHFRYDVKEITLIPSGGGVFEIKLDDQLIFSKKEKDRFPEENEVAELIREKRK